MKIDPWHTLTVTGAHYHNDPTCPGHTHPDDDTCDDEIDHELAHPDECSDEHLCCHDTAATTTSPLRSFTPETCEACLQDAHEYCTSKPLYRCVTGHETGEFYKENELPTVLGTYRVRGWYSGPDYWGEYDSGTDCEDVGVPDAPTDPATCKREPWPGLPPAPPRRGTVRFELLAAGGAA